jgi:hypothetical protein
VVLLSHDLVFEHCLRAILCVSPSHDFVSITIGRFFSPLRVGLPLFSSGIFFPPPPACGVPLFSLGIFFSSAPCTCGVDSFLVGGLFFSAPCVCGVAYFFIGGLFFSAPYRVWGCLFFHQDSFSPQPLACVVLPLI